MPDPSSRHRYSHYDVHEDIIWMDLTGLVVTSPKVIDEVFDELVDIGKRLPGRYVLACLQDVRFGDPEMATYYGKRSAGCLKHVRAILRYGVTDPLTRSYIRTEAVKHRVAGSRSNLYDTRGDALAALAALRDAAAAGRDVDELLSAMQAPGAAPPPSSRRVRAVLDAILSAPGTDAPPPSQRAPRKPGP